MNARCESARALVDGLVERASDGKGVCEFANEVAARHPLRILSTIIGVPREKEADLLRLTNELVAADDPDLQRKGEDRMQATMALAIPSPVGCCPSCASWRPVSYPASGDATPCSPRLLSTRRS